jgi:hypothetical protein
MRELKFKIWDTFNKLWLDSSIFNIGCDGTVRHFASAGNVGGVEVVQYTELKDKHGMEIYDGHILSIKLPMGGFWGNVRIEKIGTVRYESDYGGWIVQWQYSKNQHHIELNCDIAFECEILGSRFENDSHDLALLREVIN